MSNIRTHVRDESMPRMPGGYRRLTLEDLPIGWELVLWVKPQTDLDRWRIARSEHQLMNLSVHVYARQLYG